MPDKERVAESVTDMATREIGLLLIELGAGRRRGGDAVDPRVGLSEVAAIGRRVETGDLLATVHAADTRSAASASGRVGSLISIGDAPPLRTPVVIDRITA